MRRFLLLTSLALFTLIAGFSNQASATLPDPDRATQGTLWSWSDPTPMSDADLKRVFQVAPSQSFIDPQGVHAVVIESHSILVIVGELTDTGWIYQIIDDRLAQHGGHGGMFEARALDIAVEGLGNAGFEVVLGVQESSVEREKDVLTDRGETTLQLRYAMSSAAGSPYRYVGERDSTRMSYQQAALHSNTRTLSMSRLYVSPSGELSVVELGNDIEKPNADDATDALAEPQKRVAAP